jgi:hypothetical protein
VLWVLKIGNSRQFSDRDLACPAASKLQAVSGTANRTFADICLALLQLFHDLCTNFAGAARH